MTRGFEPSRKLCVAPMMAWTDRHCRYLHRLAAPHALLFTEMVTSGALRYGPAERLLRFDASEHPVALQLGGSDPDELAAAAQMGAAAGFDEINLNVGCPSPRVRQGRFGACLMREPALVGDAVAAMAAAVPVPVTVKCRLGVDDDDSVAFLERFVETVAKSGCRTFYLHARKALLNGLSPAQNRTVPPLDYARVYGVKTRFPDLEIVINGGIQTPQELDTHLAAVDGVMIGRAAYQNPLVLREMDEHLHSELSAGDADPAWEIMQAYRGYMAAELAAGTRLADMTRHALGLFNSRPGARRYRRILSDAGRLKANDLSVVDEALAAVTRNRPESRAA
ncbi:MAG: tRNA dihydrouridine(20/20a) synthase DusA [Gammaproteobacteria bacterium]|nr:tRNA dihydrouridine(20/20a) synthase DusA [Gammaproteobacteria bacterium]